MAAPYEPAYNGTRKKYQSVVYSLDRDTGRKGKEAGREGAGREGKREGRAAAANARARDRRVHPVQATRALGRRRPATRYASVSQPRFRAEAFLT